MSIPVWVLLGFAGWTIFILLATIGVYRWSLILSGKANLYDFPPEVPHGKDWYRRAMRAHANCIENLPIYTAIIVAMIATHITSPILDKLAITILLARICQSLIHIAFTMTNFTTSIRFCFFLIQLVAMMWMGFYICFTMSGQL